MSAIIFTACIFFIVFAFFTTLIILFVCRARVWSLLNKGKSVDESFEEAVKSPLKEPKVPKTQRKELGNETAWKLVMPTPTDYGRKEEYEMETARAMGDDSALPVDAHMAALMLSTQEWINPSTTGHINPHGTVPVKLESKVNDVNSTVIPGTSDQVKAPTKEELWKLEAQ